MSEPLKNQYKLGPQSQNKYGEYVPSIPLPYYLFRKVRCTCGEKFKTEKQYRGHYALEHILGLK